MPRVTRIRTVGGAAPTADGGRVGLLFQPRRSTIQSDHVAPAPAGDAPVDRSLVFAAALEAVMLGDGSRFADLFTKDVVFESPHLRLASLASLQRELGAPEDSLTDIEIVIVALDAVEGKLIAEWRLEARFTRPVLLDDCLLIEPTGAVARLMGAAVAEFRKRRIRAFRLYFDDSELLADVPGLPHRRWTSAE
jgi:SnoaL-like domain